MNVWVEDEVHALPPGSSVAELVQRLGHDAKAVAVAVNGEFVPRDARAQCVLHAGDKVDCFKPIVGG